MSNAVRVLLLHLDGKLPNLALMRIAAYQRWVVRRLDLTTRWEDYAAANFRPERMGRAPAALPILECPSDEL